MIASLDEEAQEDLRANKNLGTYKGAIYENIVGDMLVKANDNATASLNNLLKEDKYPDVKYGIKSGYKNIGFNGKFYTFPYFLAFLLKRFIAERKF